MKIMKIDLPEKIFNLETSLLVLLAPILGLVLLIIVSINLVVMPKIGDYQGMVAKLTELEGQKKITNDKTVYLQSTDQLELKKQTARISSALLPEKNAYLLIGVVRKIADKYGFQIDSFMINPGKFSNNEGQEASSTSKTGVAKIPISLTLMGSSSNYFNLINGLERSLPVLSIDSLELQSTGNVTKIDLKVSAYYLESSEKYDINKLTISDLTLKQEENDTINTLGEYTVMENMGDSDLKITGKEFKKYDRQDPFSL
jgi:hypothetical protein